MVEEEEQIRRRSGDGVGRLGNVPGKMVGISGIYSIPHVSEPLARCFRSLHRLALPFGKAAASQ